MGQVVGRSGEGIVQVSVRDTIFSALATRVGAVTVANGYASAVNSPVEKNVFANDSRSVPDGEALVSLFDEGDSEVIQYGASNRILLDTRYVIHSRIKSATRGTVPTALANNWLGDMRKLAYTLNASPTSLLAANVRSVEMEAVAGWNVGEFEALIVVPFKILYWIDQATP